MTTLPIRFALNPRLDADRLREQFAGSARIRIADFLADECADALRDELAGSNRWRHVIKGGESVFETDPATIAAMPKSERESLELAIFQEAAHGFQFRYDTIRVADAADERAACADLLNRFAEFMAARSTLSFLEAVTGSHGLNFADAQATRYRAGDFLTRHDDAVTGKRRRFAYVFGLSREWRPEWGGLLMFNGSGGQIEEVASPAFNSLDLFAVGQPHSVSFVAPYAPADRISVAGWLRELPG